MRFVSVAKKIKLKQKKVILNHLIFFWRKTSITPSILNKKQKACSSLYTSGNKIYY